MSFRTRMPLGVTAVMLPELDFDEQVALCQQIGVTHYVYRPRVIAEAQREKPWSNWGNHKFDLTPDRLVKEGASLRKKLEAAGMVGYCTVPAATADADDELVTLHLKGAAAAGCERLRVNPPPYPWQELFDYEAYLEQAVGHYRRICDLAEPYGVKIVIEMHANTAASSPGLAYNLVRDFDPAELGLIVDLPNFVGEGTPKPNLLVSVLHDWIDHLHVGGGRRVAGEYDELGFRKAKTQQCVLSESDLHVPTWLEMLVRLGRELPLVIENFMSGPPGGLRLQQDTMLLLRLLDALDEKHS